MSTSGAEQTSPRIAPPRRPSVEEQARVRGTQPIESADTYALDGAWESDAEVEEFIAFTHATRQSGSA